MTTCSRWYHCHLHHHSHQQNPGWVDILVPAYPTQAVKRVLLRCCMIHRHSAYVGVCRFPRRIRVVYAVNVVGVCLRLRHRRIDADPHCAVEHLTTRFPPVSCSWRFPFPSVHPLFLLVVSSSSATPIFFHLLAIIFVVCSVLF